MKPEASRPDAASVIPVCKSAGGLLALLLVAVMAQPGEAYFRVIPDKADRALGVTREQACSNAMSGNSIACKGTERVAYQGGWKCIFWQEGYYVNCDPLFCGTWSCDEEARDCIQTSLALDESPCLGIEDEPSVCVEGSCQPDRSCVNRDDGVSCATADAEGTTCRDGECRGLGTWPDGACVSGPGRQLGVRTPHGCQPADIGKG